MAALLLAIVALQTPFAGAQSTEAEVRADVALVSPFDAVLVVNLTSSAPVDATLPNGTRVALRPDATYSYSAPIARPVAGFALARAADVLPAGLVAVALTAPGGWTSARSPDLLVFGEGLRVQARPHGDGTLRVASFGDLRADESALLDRGLAYLAAQHGHAARDMLLVRAPAGALVEGFVVNASVAVGADAPLEELARLLARAHQAYRVVEIAPASAAWFREGEERVQAQHALMASGLRTPAEVDETFTRARAVADPDARLPQAPAGSTLARQKGLVVVRALDAELRDATSGRAGLADLLIGLDARRERLDSAAIEDEAVALGGDTLSLFFEKYVYGSEWPATPGVRDAADVFVLSFRLRTPEASPGEQVVAEYVAVNRGTQPSDLDLVLLSDGVAVRTFPVSLGVGARVNGTTTFAAGQHGERFVSLGPHSAALHVRSPARLTLARASHVPDEPRAGEAFNLLVYVQNAGETSGRAHVAVYEGNDLVQRTTEAVFDGGTTRAVTLPMRLDEPGLHALEVRLVGGGVNETLGHTVNVGLGEDTRRETPWPPLAVAIAVALALLRRT